MDIDYRMDVTLLNRAPLTYWSKGHLALIVKDDIATAGFNCSEFRQPFDLVGNAYNDVMGGQRIYLEGQNIHGSVQIYGIQTVDEYAAFVYFAGVINILDNDVREWLPYVINCWANA